MEYKINDIGTAHCGEDGFFIEVKPKYKQSLEGLDGFQYIQVLYWFDKLDNDNFRSKTTLNKPYVKGPDTLGIFATRSPMRPNPIGLTSCYVTYIDKENGIIGLGWCDAFDNTPVIDIKPYTPSVDRIENPQVPNWCNHWPKCIEESGEFNWESEFNF